MNKEIYSPVCGNVKDISKASDPVFSEKMLGDGWCIEPYERNVSSPVNGRVQMVFPTGHAIGLLSDDGIEILLHLGVDTIDFNGKYFKTFVKQDDIIKKGDLLIEYDYKSVKEEGYDADIMMIITNDHGEKLTRYFGEKTKGEIIARY